MGVAGFDLCCFCDMAQASALFFDLKIKVFNSYRYFFSCAVQMAVDAKPKGRYACEG